jgi:uncharacterized delta-60 repeat protein
MRNLILTQTLLLLITNFLFANPSSSSLPKLEINQQLLLRSGKVLAAGYVTTGQEQDLAVERYHLDGSLDRSFGKDGRFVLSIPKSNEQVFELLELNNGKIVLAGQSTSYPKAALIHLQLSESGQLNTDFSPKGYQLESLGDGMLMPKKAVAYGSGYLLSGLIKKDGQLQQFIQLFMSNGQKLKGFAQQGTLYISNNGQLKDLKVQNNHNILLLGKKLIQISPKGQILNQQQPRFHASCLAVQEQQFFIGGMTEGAFILQSFNEQAQAQNQVQTYYLPQASETQLQQIFIQEDGQIYLAGQVESSQFDHDHDWMILALNSQLQINPNFGQAGMMQLDFSQEDDELQSINQHQDNLVLLGFKNSFEDREAVMKVLSPSPQ